jgi:hypothetical protein
MAEAVLGYQKPQRVLLSRSTRSAGFLFLLLEWFRNRALVAAVTFSEVLNLDVLQDDVPCLFILQARALSVAILQLRVLRLEN